MGSRGDLSSAWNNHIHTCGRNYPSHKGASLQSGFNNWIEFGIVSPGEGGAYVWEKEYPKIIGGQKGRRLPSLASAGPCEVILLWTCAHLQIFRDKDATLSTWSDRGPELAISTLVEAQWNCRCSQASLPLFGDDFQPQKWQSPSISMSHLRHLGHGFAHSSLGPFPFQWIWRSSGCISSSVLDMVRVFNLAIYKFTVVFYAFNLNF